MPLLPIGALMAPSSGDALNTIEGWLRTISADVGRVEGRMIGLETRVKEVGDNAHKANNLAQRIEGRLDGIEARLDGRPVPTMPATNETGAVTYAMAKYIIVACVGSVTCALAVAFWVLHLAGKL